MKIPVMLAGVLLSAGASRRMGHPKAFLRIGGETFLARGVRNMQAAQCDPIVVVIPPGALNQYEAQVGGEVEIIENPNPERGMLSSLAVGFKALPAEVTHAMVALVDAPLVRPETAQVLEQHCALASELILVPTVDGQPGHPVVYPRAHWNAVVDWKGRDGARGYLAAHPDCVCQVETGDPGITRDFDTPQDLPPGVMP